MVRQNSAPTLMFWNFLGLSLVVISVGASWTMIRGNAFELELAQYKLKTGATIANVQKVSDTLAKSADRLPIAPKQKTKIKQQISESKSQLEQAQADIYSDVKQLTESTIAE